MFEETGARIIHGISRLGAVGGTVFDYFADAEIKAVSIYGNDELAAVLYEQAFWAGVEIDGVYGDREAGYAVDFGEKHPIKNINVQNIKKFNGKTSLIVCGKLPEKPKNAINISDLIQYSFYKRVLLDKVLDYKERFAPELKIVLFALPSLWYVRNRTEYETGLLRGGMYNRERLRGAIARLGRDGEYFGDISAPIGVNEIDGVYFLKDHTSKYVNVVGGYRVTEDLPSGPVRTIFTFGASTCFGMRTDDGHTIQSAAQRELNTYFDGKSPYAFLNCGNGGHPNYDKQWKMFEHCRPQNGDIAVFISWTGGGLIHENYGDKYTLIAPQAERRIFDRPHDLGEYVFLESVHWSYVGYGELGKYLGQKLTERVISARPGDARHDAVQSIMRRTETASFPAELGSWLAIVRTYRRHIGGIVMNCNPFTLGHRYLVEYAAGKSEHLFVFVVEEDRSEFPFKDRFELVKQGTADIAGITVIPSGGFIISSLTFTEYFEKSEAQDRSVDPSRDVELFARHVAPALGITVRFAGEEPLDNVTRQYNDTMRRILPKHGIEFAEIPRMEQAGGPVSASRVRKLLKERDFEGIAKLVPETTLRYLQSHEIRVGGGAD
jgi:[citrate (pro-3S)-lyase] ligase